jgi:hypothetical protein
MKWYQKTGWAIFFLFIFYPVGIFLIWKYKTWPKIVKIILSAIFGILFLFTILTISIGGGNSNTPATASDSSSSRPKASTVAPKTPSSSLSSSEAPAAVVTPPVSSAATTPSKATAQNSEIKLANITSPISQGETASISIQGQPNTEYIIALHYSSGNSTAAGLENKISDNNGAVSWSWKIGAKTKTGTYNIDISGGGEKFTTNITIQ